MDARLSFALILAGLHTIALVGGSAIYNWMLKRNVAAQHMVAAGAPPGADLMREATREVLLGQPIFGVLCYFIVWPLWTRMGGAMDAAVTPLQFIWQFAFFIFVNDTIFYFSHRVLHTRWLFKKIHVRHHRFRFVRGLVAEYAHPVEDLLNFVAFLAGPVLLGSPFAIVAAWVFLRMFETVDAHSGYNFTPWAKRHAFHHMYAARGCYGSFAGLWDRILGTEKQFHEWNAQGSPVPKGAQQE